MSCAAKPSLKHRLYQRFSPTASGIVSLLYDRKLSAQLETLESRKSDQNIDRLLKLQDGCAIQTAWRGLGAIGYELVAHLKPKHVVELGSYGGFSTCCLGLALRDHSPGSILRAVDTWQGDSHAGFYSEDVWGQFSRLRLELGLEDVIVPMRMTFEEAAAKIAGPIDLLHIDGWHTFKAVRHDLNLFRSKLAPGATVIFHDVNAHFVGMRLFWLWLSLRRPTALVPYSHGLGVARF